MAMTNRDRVGKALELLREGLAPYVEREMRSFFGPKAEAEVARLLGDDRLSAGKPLSQFDVAALLKVMWESWNDVFRKTLGFAERSLVSELREWRNKWAHQERFSSDDADRALDSAERLLAALSAPQAEEVRRLKLELRRQVYDEQVRSEKRRLGGSLIESSATSSLKPWREVAVPHPDVTSGRYQQAEFAADLWQVYLDEGSDEYRDPVEFFRRTYLTESLRQLLANAILRLTGQGGDPVVQLQTNFGGGKTHSMLALFHLASGRLLADLSGLERAVEEATRRAGNAERLPTSLSVKRVVLVGNRLSPGNPSRKPDGTEVRTLWGELAWQLGGREAYEHIRADDERATNPGDRLRELFRDYGPCLVLIDEWVAYARQLHDAADLPGGSFETQFSFAQALTESARAVPHCLVVVSLPASEGPGSPHAEDVEVGGLRGREALHRLQNVIGRVESSWRPASAEESFEIVRRRLFQPFTEDQQYRERDVVARAFAELYRTQAAEFPTECAERAYEERLKAAYPIHPEVFERLYTDWSTLLKFQRTRGVLRLMAAVIHSLWEKGDRSPLILPATLPMDDPRVQFELTRYLPDNWAPILEKDVDGPDALPVRLDRDHPNLGKYSACRRVARTIFLGSAPVTSAPHKGLEDRRIKLGCVFPGEPVAVFGDALRRLVSEATYLYQDGTRYWYATQPTVTKLAEDRAEQLKRDPDRVHQEIEKRVRQALRERGDFYGVHPLPQSSADVPDQLETRLVVLGPSTTHARGNPDSAALGKAREILAMRGSAPRLYRNTLVFLAPDESRLSDLQEAVRRYLAWESILNDREALNLDPQQVRQAEEQKQSADKTVEALLPETYSWLLVPVQQDTQGRLDPAAAVTFESIRLQGADSLAVRVSKRLRNDELLLTSLAGTRLRMELERVPLWRGDHVEVHQLVEDFARYVYLPRLKEPAVLVRAVRDGVDLLTWEQDGFAYADSYDPSTGRYRGLRCGQNLLLLDSDLQGLLVKPEAARRQIEEEQQTVPATTGAVPSVTVGGTALAGGERTSPTPTVASDTTAAPPKRFHGSVALSPLRLGAEAGRIAEEVLAHLSSLPGAQVSVTLEIHVTVPEGVPDQVVRVVTENCRTLKFTSHGFEGE
jgi:predicted AAA+ superfamily ATPase